ncbi:MAG: RnfABCDGE type electron transport complex subunit G [Deltaproteobacteria bacterium]|nr:RnfABCDGE type electron transport complex subunit G [Deltaproteobacteria bacterium]MBW2015597.1 RnfABCDGE type electron transport complex subunit G [Deltaproteobacteria bacterium]MBW2128095.1 RnfABCDGE type electron transport complex subunit G [Deltaproteobacteria bacterium]MBW2303006.1 RnfABCDGE type electron transport complex subunit G [Deltaproteobacteria bacterium]
MREMIKLFVVIVLFSIVSGGGLAALRGATKDRIEMQQLKFVKGPTLAKILKGCENDYLADRFKIADGEVQRDFFVGKFNGKRNVVAFEAFGKGFGGDIGVIVAVNVETDKIVGVGITTHSETPGLGARIKTEEAFTAQFKGMSIKEPFKVKADGGQVDAISGATVSSRGVCGAMVKLGEIYTRLKDQIVEKLKA